MYDDTYFMQQAFLEAEKAYREGEVPIGAVVVLQDQIIGRGHNLTETLQDTTAHAEMQAITAATAYLGAKYLDKCTLYVTLEPCVMCAGAMYWSKISKLVYGAPEKKYGYSVVSPLALHPKTVVVTGVMAEESMQLMKSFFKERR